MDQPLTACFANGRATHHVADMSNDDPALPWLGGGRVSTAPASDPELEPMAGMLYLGSPLRTRRDDTPWEFLP